MGGGKAGSAGLSLSVRLRGLRGATKRMSELEFQSSGDPLTPHTDFKYKEACGLERREGTSPRSPHSLRAEPARNAHFLRSGEHFTLVSVTHRVPCCRESDHRLVPGGESSPAPFPAAQAPPPAALGTEGLCCFSTFRRTLASSLGGRLPPQVVIIFAILDVSASFAR